MKPLHELKTLPEYFEAAWLGLKPFEVRLNDRNYQVGDMVQMREWFPDTPTSRTGEYSGRVITAVIAYMLERSRGLADGYVVLSLAHQVPGFGRRERIVEDDQS